MKISLWKSTSEKSPWKDMPLKKSAGKVSGELRAGKAFGPDWKGFGGCFNELGYLALKSLPAADRKKVLQLLFAKDACGFTRNRMPVGANDYAAEWYSCNDTDGDYAMKHFNLDRDEKILIPYIKEAMKIAPDLTIFASPWSPPAWMKYPKVFNYGRLVHDDRTQKAYALYLLKFVQEMQKRGIPVKQLYVQNEVYADQKFPSARWSGDELRTFYRDYAGPLFEKAGYPAELWLGTVNAGTLEQFNETLNRVLMDPGARKYISGAGVQWGGEYVVRRCAAAWPEIPLMQTENECGDGENTWKYARYIFELIQHYLTGGVESYCYWNMILPDNKGESTWGWKQNSMITIHPEKSTFTLNPEYFVMRHYAQFIRPGAQQVELAGCWNANAAAYRNPDGTTALVMMNPFPENHVVRIEGQNVALPGESFNSFVLI